HTIRPAPLHVVATCVAAVAAVAQSCEPQDGRADDRFDAVGHWDSDRSCRRRRRRCARAQPVRARRSEKRSARALVRYRGRRLLRLLRDLAPWHATQSSCRRVPFVAALRARHRPYRQLNRSSGSTCRTGAASTQVVVTTHFRCWLAALSATRAIRSLRLRLQSLINELLELVQLLQCFARAQRVRIDPLERDHRGMWLFGWKLQGELLLSARRVHLARASLELLQVASCRRNDLRRHAGKRSNL